MADTKGSAEANVLTSFDGTELFLGVDPSTVSAVWTIAAMLAAIPTDIISDTDSTDNVGSEAIKFLAGYFDKARADTIELGHATDTTLTRVSAGIMAVEGESLATQTYADAAGSFKNLLINGDSLVAQRGISFTAATTPANSDDTYLLDRMILLSDGNDVVDVTQETTVVPTGAYSSVKLEVETANKQFGILQIIEAKNAAKIIGGVASLSFKAKMAAADDNTHSLKAVVLSWDSTADTVTSDVVNAWLATTTFVANWTGENTPASNTLTTSWQTFEIENISIDTASTNNVAVFIYCDQTDGAIDDAVYIGDIQLEEGATASEFETLPYDVQEKRCSFYLPTIKGNASNLSSIGAGNFDSTSHAYCLAHFPRSRIPPTGVTVTNGYSLGEDGIVAGQAGTSIAIDQASRSSCRLAVGVGGTPFTQHRVASLTLDTGSDILFSGCEL